MSQIKLIYITTRLFDPVSRYYGALLEKSCIKSLKKSSIHFNVKTYLPFRDSNESVDSKGESLTKAIYEIDCHKLVHSVLLIAPEYELQQDSGIAFEIGYAYALNIPVILVSSNFFTYELNNKTFSTNPFFQFFSKKILYCGDINLRKKDKTLKGYIKKNKAQLRNIGKEISEILLEAFPQNAYRGNLSKYNNSDIQTIHIEFGGHQFYGQKITSEELKRHLLAKNLNISVSGRYESKDFFSGLKEDVSNLINADVVITCADGDDVNPEIACMQGIAAALKKRIYLFYSGKKMFKNGDHYKSHFNLMLSESATHIFNTPQQLNEVL